MSPKFKNHALPGTSGYACNPTYSGGRHQEDHGLKPARTNSSQDPILKKPIMEKGWWSSSRYRPWVQAPVLKKKNNGDRGMVQVASVRPWVLTPSFRQCRGPIYSTLNFHLKLYIYPEITFTTTNTGMLKNNLFFNVVFLSVSIQDSILYLILMPV
jgi:hypothetical protein